MEFCRLVRVLGNMALVVAYLYCLGNEWPEMGLNSLLPHAVHCERSLKVPYWSLLQWVVEEAFVS
jgi:hypothetical protein